MSRPTPARPITLMLGARAAIWAARKGWRATITPSAPGGLGYGDGVGEIAEAELDVTETFDQTARVTEDTFSHNDNRSVPGLVWRGGRERLLSTHRSLPGASAISWDWTTKPGPAVHRTMFTVDEDTKPIKAATQKSSGSAARASGAKVATISSGTHA